MANVWLGEGGVCVLLAPLHLVISRGQQLQQRWPVRPVRPDSLPQTPRAGRFHLLHRKAKRLFGKPESRKLRGVGDVRIS